MSRRVDDIDDPLYEEYFALLKKKQRDLLVAGEVVMWEGRNGPMLRWSSENTLKHQPGALVKGTYLSTNPNHGSSDNMRKGSYKRTNAYKELKEYLIPATEDPEVYGGLAWLLNEGFKQVEGGDIFVDANCPECNTHFKVKAYKKGDSRALSTLLEQVLDKPAQRNEIDVRGGLLHEYINTPLQEDTIEVYTITPEDARERHERQLLGEADAS